MITTEGQLQIKRYLAGYVPTIAQSVAFGIGASTEMLTDIALQFQVAQAIVSVVSYDFVNDQLVFKATVPDEYLGSIYEIGLYSLPEDPNAGNFGSRTVTTFDSLTEDWTNVSSGSGSTFDSNTTRIGADSLIQTPALSASQSDHLTELSLDLSGNSSADKFTFAVNANNNNASTVKVLFMTDGSNYYTYDLGATVQSSGYKFISLTKGSGTATGTPDWSNITEIKVTTTSASSGASSITFDGIRIEDVDSLDLDYVLVARKILASPVTKVDGQPQDIEFAIDVTAA